MIMHVPSIDMGGNDNWKVLAPQFVGELNTDGVSDVGCYLAGFEGLVSVVALYLGRRRTRQERQHNLGGILGRAVDARDEFLFLV